jgi:hypothetical protein
VSGSLSAIFKVNHKPNYKPEYMLITLPFFAFASLNSMPYIQHSEKEYEVTTSSYAQEKTELFETDYKQELPRDYPKYNMDVSV